MSDDPTTTDLPEPTSCQHITHHGQRHGDCPEPDEYCENETENGADFCSDHEQEPAYWLEREL